MAEHARLDALPGKAAFDYDRKAREYNSWAAAFRANQDELLATVRLAGGLVTLANNSPVREVKIWW